MELPIVIAIVFVFGGRGPEGRPFACGEVGLSHADVHRDKREILPTSRGEIFSGQRADARAVVAGAEASADVDVLVSTDGHSMGGRIVKAIDGEPSGRPSSRRPEQDERRGRGVSEERP